MALHAINADNCPIIGQNHGDLAVEDSGGHHYHLYDGEDPL